MEYWKSLRTDKGAKFDKDIHIDAADIAPTVTWGTSPEDVVAITGVVPDPSEASDETKRSGMLRALQYMGRSTSTAAWVAPEDWSLARRCKTSASRRPSQRINSDPSDSIDVIRINIVILYIYIVYAHIRRTWIQLR